MTQNRTHTCGELRLSDAGKAIKICGWLENLREVGSELAFAWSGTSTAPLRWSLSPKR